MYTIATIKNDPEVEVFTNSDIHPQRGDKVETIMDTIDHVESHNENSGGVSYVVVLQKTLGETLWTYTNGERFYENHDIDKINPTDFFQDVGNIIDTLEDELSEADTKIEELEMTQLPECSNMAQQSELEDLLEEFKRKHNI